MSYPSQHEPHRRAASHGGGSVDKDFWGPVEADRTTGSARIGRGGKFGLDGPRRRRPGGPGGGGRGGSHGRRGRVRDLAGGSAKKTEKTDWRRYIPSWKIVLGVLGLGTLASFVLVGVAYAMTPIPSEAQADATAEGSVAYYADGKTPLLRIGRHRESVPLTKIQEHTRDAVLAAEDRSFYSEPGVSPKGIARAVWTSVSGGDVTGGSTITQQMARNYYEGLSQERSITRKFKEILISIRMGQEKDKNYILGTYLNTVYFGRQAYGIQAASRAYFGRDVSQLTTSQSALLAAMIQQPAYFKTQGNDAAAQALRVRWNYVLDGMVTMGKLTPADRAKQVFPRTKDSWSDVKETGQSGYIQQRINDELTALGISETEISRRGLKITTSLDRRWMRYAEQAVREQGVGTWPKNIDVGLVAVDSKTGAVKAFYGGNWKYNKLDTVFNKWAQVGSSFKPYVLAASLKQGDNIKTTISGRSPQRFGNDGGDLPLGSSDGYLVHNDEGDPPMGVIDLVQATQMSVNTAYVKLGLKIGLDNVARTVEDFGIPKRYLLNQRAAGMSLGIDNIPAVYQASGYAAFANGGTPVTPHLITKIFDPQKKQARSLPWDEKKAPVLTPDQAAQATYAMRAVVTRGTGTRAALPDREVAGKTGTTERNRAAWFVGYVPQLSAAVTMFNKKNAPLTGIPGFQRSVYGGTIPAQIWKNFMLKISGSVPPQPFPVSTFSGNPQQWDTPPPPTATPSPTPTTAPEVPTAPSVIPGVPTTSPSPGLPLFPPSNPSPTATPVKTRSPKPAT